MNSTPILWSFRRCPYAIRARLALQSAGAKVELREIVLRNKPEAFLETSPSATVPTLRLTETVIDESLDIMVWALEQNDPDHWLKMPEEGWGLISINDGPFKDALDHFKYATRYPEMDAEAERDKAAGHLMNLEALLRDGPWLLGESATLADFAILPFVRQFANADRAWFDTQEWPNLIAWLEHFTESDRFARVMQKYTPWSEGDDPVWFGQV